MNLESALTAALRAMDAVDLADPPRPALHPGTEALTRREVEVLTMVGEGFFDGEMAQRLFIS